MHVLAKHKLEVEMKEYFQQERNDGKNIHVLVLWFMTCS